MKKQLLKPKYAFPDNEGWEIVCENNARRRVTNGQFIHAFGEPNGRMVDVYDKGVFVNMDDLQYIDFLNLRFNRDKLLAYLMDIINTEAARIEKVAEKMLNRQVDEEVEWTDRNQDINIFGKADSEAA